MHKYDHKQIESKWQKKWDKDNLYQASDSSKKEKFYQLETFPYPSAAGLHVGHPKGYIAEDIHARFMRAQGKEVLYTMGWDAFGLPTENYAIKVGKSPDKVAKENIANFKRQVKMFGLSYDWDREINTSSPKYYKWTQWLFLQLYKAGLAYRKKSKVNWCPKDQTVLANEQVVDGKCERCGELVAQKDMDQWFFKITNYIERLLKDLEGLDWPVPTIKRQKDWIGKSEGAEIEFPLVQKNNFVLLHGFNGSPEGIFFPWLKQELDKAGLKYQAPQLPHPDKPTEEEQVEHVLNNCKFDENTVLFGHSLGTVVAMKVLERLDVKIAGLVLAGAFVEHNFKDRPRPFDKTFNWNFDFEKIKQNIRSVTILSDPNDFAVPFEQGKIVAEKLEGYLIEQVAIKPHFTDKKEPLILKSLLNRIKVFTTRADTLFGGTFLVLAPEHPLVPQITTEEQKKEVQKYIEQARKKTEIQRTALEKDKTGVFTGAYAINPATKKEIPVWVADFVLASYGHGAVFADAHDERDFEFAKKYNIPLKPTLKPKDGKDAKKIRNLEICFSGKGVLYDSGEFSGLTSEEAIPKIGKKFGKLVIQYKLRDWSVSRQRYWGAPIPMIHCEKCGIVPVPEKDLPVLLPELKDYRPKGMAPLASSEDFLHTKCPECGNPANREAETLDTFVDSSWYFMRYTDPSNDKKFADAKKLAHWLPVDLYVIGAEHTVLHLLYSRFITKALFDQGQVKFQEPFLTLRHLGLIQGSDGQKMSKSRGNVVNPDEVVEEFGADAFRLYEMFMGPFEEGQPWQTKGVVGVKRFLDKVCRHSELDSGSNTSAINKLIKKITKDIQAFKFNTAVSAFMEFLNQNKSMSKQDWETYLVLLAPFAPHITEELWEQLGHKDSIHKQIWPKYDKNLVKDETVTVVVQVNGKVRASLDFPAGTDKDTVKEQALAQENAQKYLEGKKIIKEIFVKDRLINFVSK